MSWRGRRAGRGPMACVYIPVQNSEEEVRVALDQLPRDASDILDILKAEQAPLDLWLVIAVSSPLAFQLGYRFVLHWFVVAGSGSSVAAARFLWDLPFSSFGFSRRSAFCLVQFALSVTLAWLLTLF